MRPVEKRGASALPASRIASSTVPTRTISRKRPDLPKSPADVAHPHDKGPCERAANADGHAYSQAMAWTLTGLVRVRQGRFEEARLPLERSLEACRERQLAI